MKKVVVIGCGGSGKSVFSRSFAQITRLPLYHLDNIWWREDGTTITREEFDAVLSGILSAEEWIIDGNYQRTMERRIAASDTVIFFDLPVETCVEGIKARQGKPRPDMPWRGAGDSNDAEFMSLVYNYGTNNRPRVIELLEKYSNKNIIVFKTRAEADDFLGRLEG